MRVIHRVGLAKATLATHLVLAASCLLILTTSASAQEATQTYFPGASIGGGMMDNSGLIPYDQAYFAFEVESVLSTLKEVPLWDELEAMLDNPYAIALDPSVGGNYQGFPSYRTTLPRRRSFVYRDAANEPCAPGTNGCNEIVLPGFVVHPLNYNHMSGEELRLLNVEFEGAEWMVPDQLVGPFPDSVDPTNALGEYQWSYREIEVSPGEDRIEEDEAVIDFNSPIAPDSIFSLITVEPIPAEGARVTGGDPGEPGYMGFGVLGRNPGARAEQYSTPALPLPWGSGPGTDITPRLGTGNRRLYDPARGFIQPRNAGGVGGLRKPTLRDPNVTPGGNPNNPAFTANSAEELEEEPGELLPSTENDYIRRAGAVVGGIPTGRQTAVALGKALFWDMQVGSDAVQACGSCHFHAGADNRTKNQINPNHLGGDLTFQIRQPNEELVAEDFPFHKRYDPDVAGDGILNEALVERDVNDVASSMGVVFHNFIDIPDIGMFTPPSGGVASVLPDLGEHVPDPIPGFNDPVTGLSAIRRVEPRNTPTFFGSAMNFDNFWDGRARHDFNGGSAFGASDPQHHVFVDQDGTLVATRQIIRFASLASLATGPGLSEFEMSFLGRNWAKIAKKLLQPGVTPLANQLVATDDSVLGPFSNQGGSLALAAERPTAPGKPGLAFTYPELIRAAFFPALWQNTTQHLDGGHEATEDIPILVDTDMDGNGDTLGNADVDPFDGYSLAIDVSGPANPTDTDEFTQMEANFSLFWGLSIHVWGSILIPDDAPIDRFYDENPDAFMSFGESNEKFLVPDLLTCVQTGGIQPCFHEVGNFKRDAGVTATLNCVTETCTEGVVVEAGGTRGSNDPDPLFGMDLFLGSNLSLKNPLYRSFRCGECHAGATLTDHTVEVSHQFSFNDFAPEFGEPAVPVFPEPLGRSRIITGFSLESEVNGNAQDGIERNVADFCAVGPCQDANGFAVPTTPSEGGPQGQALFDNGVYNIGVTPIANDIGRGGNDAFGWPLSLGVLALKNIGGLDYTPGGHLASDGFALPMSPGNPLPNFDPSIDPTGGGIFEPTGQDQQLNPGFEEELEEEVWQLPPYLAPWASNINVGDETQQDEVFVGLNTLCAEPILEGFVDTFGPINPAATVGETYNMARQVEMATWPVVNRVNRMGSFKAPSLRNVELTGPYFHNGGNLTLREQLDFYLRGGNFPLTNAAHRDFLIMNLNIEDEALGGVDPVTGEPAFTEEEKEHARVSLVDFLLELTDERVKFERAPFDHPEIFVPLDGTAPMNDFGRDGFLERTSPDEDGVVMFRRIPAVGQGGNLTPLPNFLGISSTPLPGDHNDHYDRK